MTARKSPLKPPDPSHYTEEGEFVAPVGAPDRSTGGCTCGPLPLNSKTSHCSICHCTFTTPAAFDQHRPAIRKNHCIRPDLAGLELKAKDRWGYPGDAFTEGLKDGGDDDGE